MSYTNIDKPTTPPAASLYGVGLGIKKRSANMTYPDGITELTYKGYRITKNGSTFDLFDSVGCFVNVCETVEDAIEYVDFLTTKND